MSTSCITTDIAFYDDTDFDPVSLDEELSPVSTTMLQNAMNGMRDELTVQSWSKVFRTYCINNGQAPVTGRVGRKNFGEKWAKVRNMGVILQD